MDKFDRVMFVFFISLTSFFMIIGIDIIQNAVNTEIVIIEGEVIDISPFANDDGSIDYLYVTFDNGKSYKIRCVTDVDFTVNSKLIVQLRQSKSFLRNDDFWYIDQIIKSPKPYDLE